MRKIRTIFSFLLLCSIALAADKPYRILNSFNAGELSALLTTREDLSKYQAGCSLMENMIPLPQGGAQKRPGTIYVAESKNNTAIRLVPFEYSTTQSYIIELGNQYARFFTNNAAVTSADGTEDISALDNIVAHWLLNEVAGTAVADDNDGTHNGTATADTSLLAATGKVGTGCFDLDGQYAVAMTDHGDFSFDDSSDAKFSIACWAYVTQQSNIQNLLSKWKDGTAREWRFSLDSDRKLQLHLCDDSINITAISQWKLNDDAANTVVTDGVGLQNGVATQNTDTAGFSVAGKISTCFDFGGDQAVEINDQATHSFGDGSDDSAFSIAAWVFVEPSTANQRILSKWKSNANEEWMLHLNPSEQLVFILHDDSKVATIGVTMNDILSAGWHFVAATYPGQTDAGPTAASLITLYVDGSAIAAGDTTISNNANYVAMENSANKVVIGASYDAGGSLEEYCQNKIDNVALFASELTAAEVTSLWNSGDGTETLDSGFPHRISDDAISIGWHFLCVTYDSSDAAWTGATAANYITLYVDGAAVASTATNETNYAAMENGATTPKIGCQESSAAANEKFWGDKIDEVSIYSDVLSAAEVATLYDSTAYEITTPYLTADLFDLKYEQSADVLYITHPDYETRKLSRLANATWTLTALDIQTGPFRTQNTTTTGTIAASATTGTITLTASGCTPFVGGTTEGHLPSGSGATSKSQTGALFKLVHPLDTLEYSDTLEDDYAANQTEGVSWMSCGTIFKGGGWKFTTDGTWLGTVEVQRNYTIGAAHGASGWETVYQFSGVTTARNTATATRTEDDADADYRVIFTDDTSGTILAYFETDQTEHIGVVEITAVTSATSATGTVIKTLGSTDATFKWSEGSWSNYRGWPATVTFFEDRLVFGGNTSQPDTIWGSATGDYENMLAGTDDDEALIFTLTSRQVNVIQWLVAKDKILIGTSGAEWTLSGSSDEPLTPSNVKAEKHSTYGSENLQAILANESVLFFQQGAERVRELAYNWELDSYVAPDMTILAKEVTGDGITDTAFQQTPDAILWCTRDDGEIATFSYERKEQITAWSRQITDGDFESVAAIFGSTEDEIWVSVKRTIDDNDVRYIEYFSTRDFGSEVNDAYFVDCGATYTSTSSITDLTWLEGETVYVLADGDVHDSNTVSSSTIGLDATYTTVQVGLPYTVQMKTMPLSWIAQGGMTIHGRMKRINKVITSWYESGDFYLGKNSTSKELYSIARMTTNEDRKTFPAGYDRYGYVYIYQQSPEPLTLLALMIEFMVQ